MYIDILQSIYLSMRLSLCLCIYTCISITVHGICVQCQSTSKIYIVYDLCMFSYVDKSFPMPAMQLLSILIRSHPLLTAYTRGEQDSGLVFILCHLSSRSLFKRPFHFGHNKMIVYCCGK